MGNLLPRINEGRIRDDKIPPHAFGEAETNVGYETLLGIGAEIFTVAFTGMVQMFEFPKARYEGQFQGPQGALCQAALDDRDDADGGMHCLNCEFQHYCFCRKWGYDGVKLCS